jgi:S-formylglutathione hydrolase FrmB
MPGFRLAAVIVVWCLFAPAAATAGDARITEERSLGGRGMELTIATPAFAAPVKVQVYLPVAYDAQPARRWPVTYYLAGTNHDENDFAEQYDGESLTRAFESIMVSPRGDSGYWSDWYNAGAFGPPKYETFVIVQLIPLIDARFRTDATGAARAVLGESMGGYGTMMMAARHPDLFAAASSLSGAVDSNYEPMTAVLGASPLVQGGTYDAVYGPRATQEVRWRGHNPADLAENLRDVDLQLRSAVGLPDPGRPETVSPSCVLEYGVHEMTVRLHDDLAALKIPHAYKVDYGPFCHDVPTFEAEIADSLPLFTRVFAHPRQVPERFTYRSIEPAFDVWGWHVEADRARALEFLRMQDAGRSGVTLTGSGKTSVTTPPLFAGASSVDVVSSDTRFAAVPDARGRITFTVDLGPAHTQQQYTPGAPTGFATRRVTFEPRALVRVARPSCARRSVTIRLGARVTRAVILLDGRRVRSVRGRALRRIVLPGLSTGTHRLTIRTRTARGPWRSSRRTVRICADRRT